MKISAAAKKAVMIGVLCSCSYLAVYVARNILGSVSPQIIEQGVFSTENIGVLSSVYFVTYAIGQLVNGMIGDRIRAKYMISFGLVFAGICNALFSAVSSGGAIAYIVYGATGLGLSMIYAPMTKVVAENTEPVYATRCSLGYTFASYFGSPLAGVLASFLLWKAVFAFSSVMLIIMGVICFGAFTVFEKKGVVRYGMYGHGRITRESINSLVKHRIVKFAMISILTGVVRTSVVFWLPTYISQHLGFSSDRSALLFTVASLVISSSAFAAVFLFECLGRRLDLTMWISFIGSAVSFLLVFFLRNPALNLTFMVLAILCSNCASSMLWSRYCPSLRDTGVTSTATGFLDFVSYMAAAASSSIFANAVSGIGWSGLILVWFGLMLVGVLITSIRQSRE